MKNVILLFKKIAASTPAHKMLMKFLMKQVKFNNFIYHFILEGGCKNFKLKKCILLLFLGQLLFSHRTTFERKFKPLNNNWKLKLLM